MHLIMIKMANYSLGVGGRSALSRIHYDLEEVDAKLTVSISSDTKYTHLDLHSTLSTTMDLDEERLIARQIILIDKYSAFSTILDYKLSLLGGQNIVYTSLYLECV